MPASTERSMGSRSFASRAAITGGAALAACVITFCAPSAQADIHLAIGSRFEPLRYTSAYFPNSSTPGPASLYGAKTEPFQSTSLNPYLALFFAQRYGVMAALDIAYAKLSGEVQGMGAAMPVTDGNSYFQFGISIGFKAYISTPRANKVAPYVYADLFKYFASISTDNAAITGEQAAAQAALMSPIGATVAVGAEYFLSPSFSIGSEIFGLRISNVSGEYHDGQVGMQTRHSASYTAVSFYTGITLNFRFQVAASVKSSDEDHNDEERSSRKRQSSDYPLPPAAPPPPPPTPEAVD